MSWKTIGQTASATTERPKHKALQELDGVNALIDWTSIEAKLSDIHPSKLGEKAWPPLMMFKALLLQSWYNLSDPSLEHLLGIWWMMALIHLTSQCHERFPLSRE
ncbi:MAG: hypothetical protein BWK79_07975 [Beggiatoa sp. IS2]|nr:MAG: hypothetical protein BWK79_07975 [Beggiatoa sp. IS2]